jgi:hypothetical protein
MVRYWLKQIVEGLKHIYSTGRAHSDLRVDDTLLGDWFNRKIGGFEFHRQITTTSIRTESHKMKLIE